MTKKKGEIIFNLFLIAAACGGFIIALGYEFVREGGHVAAGFFPRVSCVMIIAACLLNILCILKKSDYALKGKVFSSKENAIRFVTFALAVIAYMIGVKTLGMYFSTAVFVFCIYKFYDKFSWLKSLEITAGTILFIYFVFAKLLGLRLPGGLIF